MRVKYFLPFDGGYYDMVIISLVKITTDKMYKYYDFILWIFSSIMGYRTNPN
jgi:hypothetical protein